MRAASKLGHSHCCALSRSLALQPGIAMASALSFGLGDNNELLVSTPAAEKSESIVTANKAKSAILYSVVLVEIESRVAAGGPPSKSSRTQQRTYCTLES